MSWLVVFSLSAAVFLVNGANLGDKCQADSDCSGTNTYCQMLFTDCNSGMCSCKQGFGIASPSSCKPGVTYGQACDDSNTCTDSTCLNGFCNCTTGTYYNTLSKYCVIANKMVVTQACTSNTDCFSNDPTNPVTCSGNVCTCPNGFVMDITYNCRRPHLGEPCSGTCVPMITMNDFLINGAQETETCQSGTCACPVTSQVISANIPGQMFTACQTRFNGTKLSGGAQCTQSNSCVSGLCYQCGTTNQCVTLKGPQSLASLKSLSPVMSLSIIIAVLKAVLH